MQFSVALAPELARTEHPTPPDVVATPVGILVSVGLPAVTAQLVIAIGDFVLASDASRVQELLARLAVVALLGNDSVVTLVALGGGLLLVVRAAGAAQVVVPVGLVVTALRAEAGVVGAVAALTVLVEGLDVGHVALAAFADAAGVACCAPVVVARRAPVGVALGAPVVVTTRTVDTVVVALAVVVAAVLALGDVVTGEQAAVLLVDGTLVVGHGRESATRVVDLLPRAVSELLLEGEAGDDEPVFDFLLVEGVGEHDVAGRVFPAQLIGVGTFPLHGRVDFGADEAGGGRGDDTVTLGDGTVHGLLLCEGPGWTWMVVVNNEGTKYIMRWLFTITNLKERVTENLLMYLGNERFVTHLNEVYTY